MKIYQRLKNLLIKSKTPARCDRITDGYGNFWDKCDYIKCDLHIVRPGKVQCGNCPEES